MALDPLTIKEGRGKISQFQVDGTITSSKLIKKDNECLHTYQSKIDNGSEEISFNYAVLVNDCTTDSIYSIKSKPFVKNSNVTLSLTEKEPHYMVTSKTNFEPESQNIPVPYIIGSALFLIVIIFTIWFLYKKGHKNKK